MNKETIKKLLDQVRLGETSVEEALARLENLPFESLDYARLDHHRALRKGFPEVVFCQGKTVEQVVEIISRLAAQGAVLATRAAAAIYEAVAAGFPAAEYNAVARTIFIPGKTPAAGDAAPLVMVVSAGTSDIPVAEEAAVTATALGSRVERLFDVGVAGIHRLLEHRARLQEAAALIVVAGMDGVLPTVVAGLVSRPVVAVPTSVGYGASFQGLAALLTMLNACSPGVAVVNIDNGFGAGYFAATVARGL